ncbi:MAG: hypothetical protein M3010_08870, partial [Candidatus Dormibacteraeota bacterium]|nr:hypothetical protein [Candidatus Dormibacteraeota bacterium]
MAGLEDKEDLAADELPQAFDHGPAEPLENAPPPGEDPLVTGPGTEPPGPPLDPAGPGLYVLRPRG